MVKPRRNACKQGLNIALATTVKQSPSFQPISGQDIQIQKKPVITGRFQKLFTV